MKVLGIEVLVLGESVFPAGEEYVSSQGLSESRFKVDSPARAGYVRDHELRPPDLSQNCKVDIVVLQGLIHAHGQVSSIP